MPESLCLKIGQQLFSCTAVYFCNISTSFSLVAEINKLITEMALDMLQIRAPE